MIRTIITIIFLFPFAFNIMTTQMSQDKISNDLIGQEIQTTDEDVKWLFEDGDPINYVILDQRTTGPKNFRRIDYKIYLRTRKSISGSKLERGSGLLKLTYKRSRSRNHYYLSLINQQGFHVDSISVAEAEKFDEIDRFWLEFQYAVSFNYKEKVAAMFNFPFSSDFLGNYSDADDLISRYDELFTDEVKSAVKYAIMTPEKKSKGKRFNAEKDDFVQMCHYKHRVLTDGLCNLFVAKLIDGEYKIAYIVNRKPSQQNYD